MHAGLSLTLTHLNVMPRVDRMSTFSLFLKGAASVAAALVPAAAAAAGCCCSWWLPSPACLRFFPIPSA